MSALETIEAAIGRLEELKTSITPGPWALTYERATHPRIWGNLDDEDADLVATTHRGHHDAELIVTLHQTIDGQVAILQSATVADWSRPTQIESDALALANAILGVAA